MRAVVTRVKEASVTIDGKVNGQIGQGFLILLGVAPEDDEAICTKMVDKICKMRIFEDEKHPMNADLTSVNGQILVVSQFTLFADVRKGNRPSFTGAARPEIAIPLYEMFMEQCRARGFHVEHGEFGADMQVMSVNDGPVTIIVDSDQLKR